MKTFDASQLPWVALLSRFTVSGAPRVSLLLY